MPAQNPSYSSEILNFCRINILVSQVRSPLWLRLCISCCRVFSNVPDYFKPEITDLSTMTINISSSGEEKLPMSISLFHWYKVKISLSSRFLFDPESMDNIFKKTQVSSYFPVKSQMYRGYVQGCQIRYGLSSCWLSVSSRVFLQQLRLHEARRFVTWLTLGVLVIWTSVLRDVHIYMRTQGNVVWP